MSVLPADIISELPIEPKVIIIEPVLDGKLDDQIWKDAIIISDFKQREPIEGADPTEKTEILMLYTSDALYIGVRAYDSNPEAIVGTVMKRDNFDSYSNDGFEIAIDSYNDGRNGYWFFTNPLGVRVDAQFFDEGNIFVSNWNGVWEAKSSINPNGWESELKIPFSTLRFDQSTENTMGINFFRRIIRTNERLYAPLVPLDRRGGSLNVSLARKYLFKGIIGGGSVQLKPYVLSGIQNKSVGQDSDTDTEGEFGIDLKYNINDNLLSNLSYNTDFAQAEVDEIQINLSRFSLFFPEKRGFFLENSGIFSFGLSQDTEIFFSRRIGLATDEEGNNVTVPILFGGKLTGKIKNIDIGVLDVQTTSKENIPSENFSVFRLKAGIAPRSYVGGTITNISSENGSYDRTVGSDFLVLLKREVGIRAFSATNISSENNVFAARSSAFNLSLFRKSERFAFTFDYLDVGALFNPRMGFVRRTDIKRLNGFINKTIYLETEKYRRITPEYRFNIVQDHDGELLEFEHSAYFTIDFRSKDRILFTVTRSFEYIPVAFPIFKSVLVPVGKYNYLDAGILFGSKGGRKFQTELFFVAGSYLGGSRLISSFFGRWLVNKNLTLTQIYERFDISLENDSFTTFLLRSRADYSLNTSLSVSTLIQYDNASEKLGLNLRLNYLVSEGRELFLVWNQIYDEPQIRNRLDFGKNDNSLLLFKINYLFSL